MLVDYIIQDNNIITNSTSHTFVELVFINLEVESLVHAQSCLQILLLIIQLEVSFDQRYRF